MSFFFAPGRASGVAVVSGRSGGSAVRTTVHAASRALAGPTPAGSPAVRESGPRESGGGVLGANLRGRKTAFVSLVYNPRCSMRAFSPCSSRSGEAVVWTGAMRGYCGRHIEQLHAAQIAGAHR